MKLYEIIYREITDSYLNGINKFTQKGISEKLNISIGNVNKSLKNLERINAIKIGSRSFSIIAIDKVLLYWATHRKLEQDIIYKAESDIGIDKIEGSLPGNISFTAYTAYKHYYGNIPADYSEIYLYASESAIDIIKKRFPKQGKFPNIFVLKTDSILLNQVSKTGINTVPISNVFVDLWNIRTWYAKEFVDALSKKIFG